MHGCFRNADFFVLRSRMHQSVEDSGSGKELIRIKYFALFGTKKQWPEEAGPPPSPVRRKACVMNPLRFADDDTSLNLPASGSFWKQTASEDLPQLLH